MEGQAGILEQRVQALALDGRRIEPQERVRGQDDKCQKTDADQPLHRQHPRAQGRRQVTAERRDHQAVDGEDQHPKDHRALVVSPHTGNLVEHRLQRVGILGDVRDREVGNDERPGQAPEGQGNEHELTGRRGPPQLHQPRIAALRTDQRQRSLDYRQAERENEGVMSNLRDHGLAPPFHWPDFLIASATSGGM